jgi:flagellar biosynthesis protein FliQ
MTPEVVVDVFRDALSVVITIVSAIILPGLLTGLVVAVFQAATSINEQTLSFLPRLIVTLLTLMFLGHWFFGTLVEFSRNMFINIPNLIG